jgi:hypothetical protein
MGVLAVLALAPATVAYVRELDAVDRCLDAGGSVDYTAMRCDHATNQPYVPFSDRHAVLLLATGCVEAGLVIAALATRRRFTGAAQAIRPVV